MWAHNLYQGPKRSLEWAVVCRSVPNPCWGNYTRHIAFVSIIPIHWIDISHLVHVLSHYGVSVQHTCALRAFRVWWPNLWGCSFCHNEPETRLFSMDHMILICKMSRIVLTHQTTSVCQDISDSVPCSRFRRAFGHVQCELSQPDGAIR